MIERFRALGRRQKLTALAVVACLVIVVAGAYEFTRSTHYTAQLTDAVGLRVGAEVQIAGIKVGQVTDLSARGKIVSVGFDTDRGVRVTQDTQTQVKIGSLLGKRFLQLYPGTGPRLGTDGVIPVKQSQGTYAIERFWLDEVPALSQLDVNALSGAINVLSTDLHPSPASTTAAIAGLSAATDMVAKRDQQITSLVQATRAVTDDVVAQRDTIASLMTNADQVLATVASRRDAIAALLKGANDVAVRLSAMAQANAPAMQSALANLRTITDTLNAQKDALAKTLDIANPALRVYVNASGDGPWVGVNVPGFVLPDSFWCLSRVAGSNCQ